MVNVDLSYYYYHITYAYFFRVAMLGQHDRYPTNTKKEQYTELKKYDNVNVDVHANSKSVSICKNWLLFQGLCRKRKLRYKKYNLDNDVLRSLFVT